MAIPFPEPTTPEPDRREVLLGYLTYFRAVLLDKLAGLPEESLRSSLLPSGWSPLELLHHVTQVERRWLEWGFAGLAVDDPWSEERDGHWYVDPVRTAEQLRSALAEQARRTEETVRAHALDEVGAPGERWDGAAPAPLERVLLHLLQEYARHVGQLDVVRELLDGATGG